MILSLNSRFNENDLWPLLLEAVFRDNVLPLTSSCNLKCIFCSSRGNPQGVKTVSFPPLDKSVLQELIPFLDPGRKIIIGESSTRLCEGEPLMHPFFSEVVEEISELFPHTPLQITTNGTLLSPELIYKMSLLKGNEGDGSVGGVEFIFSLNSASSYWRCNIMGDKDPERALKVVDLCSKYGVDFHGSLVAAPQLTGWEELKQTLYFLENAGALTTRVFLPGITRYSNYNGNFSFTWWSQIRDFTEEVNRELEHPVTVEPPLKKDLLARVEGVIEGSTAEEAGLQKGDIIMEVEEAPVLSAVDAFSRLKKGSSPFLRVDRPCGNCVGGKYLTTRIEKEAGQSPGVVIYSDLDPYFIQAVNSAIERYNSFRTVLLTSVLAAPLWEEARRRLLLPRELDVYPVENKFWGGSISCAGLLTVDDFKEAMSHISLQKGDADLFILPFKPFDRQGKDLLGKDYTLLKDSFPWLNLLFL